MDKVNKIREKIKYADEFYLESGVGITISELNWLIEQAEKVEKLEKENKINSAFNIHAIRVMTDVQIEKVVSQVKKVML